MFVFYPRHPPLSQTEHPNHPSHPGLMVVCPPSRLVHVARNFSQYMMEIPSTTLTPSSQTSGWYLQSAMSLILSLSLSPSWSMTTSQCSLIACLIYCSHPKFGFSSLTLIHPHHADDNDDYDGDNLVILTLLLSIFALCSWRGRRFWGGGWLCESVCACPSHTVQLQQIFRM